MCIWKYFKKKEEIFIVHIKELLYVFNYLIWMSWMLTKERKLCYNDNHTQKLIFRLKQVISILSIKINLDKVDDIVLLNE